LAFVAVAGRGDGTAVVGELNGLGAAAIGVGAGWVGGEGGVEVGGWTGDVDGGGDGIFDGSG